MTTAQQKYEATMARIKATAERERPLEQNAVKGMRLTNEIAAKHEAQLRAMNEANDGIAIMQLAPDAPLTGIQLFEEFKAEAEKQGIWFEELPDYMMRLTAGGHRHERTVQIHVMTRGKGINFPKIDYDEE